MAKEKTMKKIFLTMFSVLFALFAVVGIGGITASAQEGEQTKNYLEVGVTLTEDITFNFNVVSANDYATAKMHFAYLNGKEKTGETTLENGNGTIKFSELPAQYMAEDVTVTLTLVKADGTQDVQAAQTVSLSSYARTVLDKSTDSAKDKALKKLVIDMLYYGDAAQSYLAEGAVADSQKATAVLTDAEKNAYALAEKAEKSDYALENNNSAYMRWVRYGAKFDSRLGVFFEFVAKNEENLSVKFNDGTIVKTFETRTETVNGVETTVYKAIKYLSVLDYTSPVTAALYSGEGAIGSPITYSVNSLTYDFEETANEYALAIAATTYASSAVDYKNGVGYYYFEAEDERVALTKGKNGQLKVENTYIGEFACNVGAAIEYTIVAEKATTAKLYVSVIQRKGEKFTDVVSIKVNEKEITSDAVVPANPTGSIDWTSFITVEIGNIELIAGKNVISFTDISDKTGYNFDKIILKCANSLDWVQVCELKIEAEDYTAINNPLPADGSKGTFGVGSGGDAAKASGGKIIKDVGNIGVHKDFCNGEAYLEYVIYSDEDVEVSFSIVAGIAAQTEKSAFGIKVTYQDESSADFTEAEGVLPSSGWSDYCKVNYGKLSLKKGKNVIRITIKGKALMNLDYFTFRAQNGANLTVTEQA